MSNYLFSEILFSQGLFSDGLLGKNFYIIPITLLLPLTAALVVLQANPYQALVVRGILGAIAALVYALFGAADVALTEALVGTMLSITLYAIAVRSSMNMRLGILDSDSKSASESGSEYSPESPFTAALRAALKAHHMRLELVTYDNAAALQAALIAKEIHTAYDSKRFLKTRIEALYSILKTVDSPATANLTYLDLSRPLAQPLPAQPSDQTDQNLQEERP
ncbi:MAG: sodium:proton antiporter [Phormidesmis priestleyi]|uniref:Sodium:proton antiporter n=1 Tax=Phormidesmis priestleyi TaxID=268141 RepID=A0A2W4XGD0_9CYAN|nr:MAG: sodium:proton antiporter [Phormidesmis priestleyi]